jgi:hypothetical protein
MKNLFSHVKRRKHAEDVREQGANKDIRVQEGGSERMNDKTAQ